MTLTLLNTNNTPAPSLSELRRLFILDYMGEYRQEFGEKCPEPFVKCLGTLKATFEAIDEETGEILILYPEREEWKEEIKKFFYKSAENWYRKNNRCTFYTFCKNYGRYNHHLPKKPEAQTLKTEYKTKPTRVMIHCSDCKKNHYSDEFCQ